MNLLNSRIARATALIVAAGFVAHAAADGTITLTVTDRSGKPIQGALVAASSPNQIGGKKTSTTDAQGRVRFSNLAPGSFKLEVSASGFQSITIPTVGVQVDQVTATTAKMSSASEAVVEVISAVAAIDVTSVTTGTHFGQEELQAMPLGRGQLSALTMVPGVISTGGNPALAAGLNRSNIGGAQGAANNTYLLDGIDVTNPETGTLRTTIAQELIQDQDIKTGGITAEYSARAGLFTNAVTINGSNEFSGGVSIYSQNPSLAASVGRDKPLLSDRKANEYSAWVSGPIIKDKVWYVVSASKLKDTSTVTLSAANGGGKYDTVNNDESRIFGKLTWQIASDHMLQGIFSRNPGEFDNGAPTVLPHRLFLTKRGGNRFSLNYTWSQPSTILEVKVARHEELDTVQAFSSSLGPQTTVRSSTSLTPLQIQLGNSSANTTTEYQKNQVRIDFTKFFDFMGSHVLKTGYQGGDDSFTETRGINNGALFENFDAVYTMNQISASVSGAVRGARTKTLGVINNNATYASVKAFLDANGNGTVSDVEFGNYSFGEQDPAHPGTYYGYRNILNSSAESTPKLKTFGLYVQDAWQIGRWNLTLGVRGDDYKFSADSGEQIWKSNLSDNLAPRIGVSWDVNGNGRTKLFGFWGRYIDPMKLDMVSFGGSLISTTTNEDLRINNTWVTENVRGGTAVRDAALVDSLVNPKTDELRLGFSKDFGKYSLDIAGTYRHDFDIVEDFDPGAYSDPDALEAEARTSMGIGGEVGKYTGAGSAGTAYSASGILNAAGKTIIDYWRALVLPESFWATGGRTGAQSLEDYHDGKVNFFLGNLPGAYRTFRSLDVTLTRKLENKWGGFVSGTIVSASGNSLSSGNADFQGDLAQYDPRLPFTNGRLEGSPDYLAKGNVYYKWDNGLMVSMTYQMHSGYHYSDSVLSSGRTLQATPVITSSTTGRFYENQAGRNRTPVVRSMDLRVQYGATFAKKIRGEVYVDVFNAFNTQGPTDLAEGTNVRAGFAPHAPFRFQAPLAMRIGARLKF